MNNIDLTSFLAVLSEKNHSFTICNKIDKSTKFKSCAKKMAMDIHLQHDNPSIFIAT